MKNFILLAIFIFVMIPILFSQEYEWIDISDKIPNQDASVLTDIFFINENEGWITTSSAFEIYHTTDGGLSFEIQPLQQYTAANSIFMLDDKKGFAGGQSGAVYYTNNGGASWNLINGFLPSDISGLTFPPDSDTGYICGGSGWVAKIDTTHLFDMEKLVNANLYAISFPIKGEGWVCGGSIIRHYINGEWIADCISSFAGFNAIHFIDTLNGWASGDNGIVIHTSDGYNFINQLPSGSGQTLNDIFFLDEYSGWSVGVGQEILYTTDGGNNWVHDSIQSAVYGTLRSIYFLNSDFGFICGTKSDDNVNYEPALYKYFEISGINENIQSFKFEIYPNPAKSKLNIFCSEFKTEVGTIEILSTEGRTLKKKTVGKENEVIEMDLKELAAGMYMCKITIGNKTSTRKLIIE